MSFSDALELLSTAFDVLVDRPDNVVDDTCLSRLLDWIRESLRDSARRDALARAARAFIDRSASNTHPVTLAFALRLSASEPSLCSATIEWLTTSGLCRHADARVRCSSYEALTISIVNHYSKISRSCLVDAAILGLGDSSLFVAKSAGEFLAAWICSGQTIAESQFDVLLSNVAFDSRKAKNVFGMITKVFDSSSSHGTRLLGELQLLGFVETQLRACENDSIVQVLVDFIVHLVKHSKDWDIDWTELLVECSSSTHAKEWLTGICVSLLERGFIQHFFRCIANFSTTVEDGLFQNETWLSSLVFLPVHLASGGTREHYNLPTTDCTMFTSLLARHFETRSTSIRTVLSSLHGLVFLAENRRIDDLPLDAWCRRLISLLKLTCDVVAGESDHPSWALSLVGNEKVIMTSLKLMQRLCGTRQLESESYQLIIDACIGLLQLKSPSSRRVCLLLEILGDGIVVAHSSDETEANASISFILDSFLVNPSWEVRDSTYELVSTVLSKTKRTNGTPLLDLFRRFVGPTRNGLQDGQSFVRSSALQALGEIFQRKEIYVSYMEENSLEIKDIVSDVCNVLVNDTEAFARRSAVQVLLVWLDGLAGFRDSLTRSDSLDVRSPILDALHRATDDFDWEVKRHVLDFWSELTRTESSTKATSILERANALDDVIKALNDPNRIVREKASEIARCLAASSPTRIVDEIVDKEADGGCGGELTSSFDADAISLLQDLIACGGGRSRDDDSMLLDCY